MTIVPQLPQATSESVSGMNTSSDSTPNVDNELKTLCVLLLTLKSSFNLSEACF